MNYGRLKELIKKKFGDQKAFAEAMGMSYTALNLRLNNRVEWTTAEIVKACELLDIPLENAHLYFFVKEV